MPTKEHDDAAADDVKPRPLLAQRPAEPASDLRHLPMAPRLHDSLWSELTRRPIAAYFGGFRWRCWDALFIGRRTRPTTRSSFPPSVKLVKSEQRSVCMAGACAALVRSRTRFESGGRVREHVRRRAVRCTDAIGAFCVSAFDRLFLLWPQWVGFILVRLGWDIWSPEQLWICMITICCFIFGNCKLNWCLQFERIAPQVHGAQSCSVS